MSDDIVLEIYCDKTTSSRIQVSFARRDDSFGLVLDQMIHDGEVVGRQIPNNIDVMLEKAQVHSVEL